MVDFPHFGPQTPRVGVPKTLSTNEIADLFSDLGKLKRRSETADALVTALRKRVVDFSALLSDLREHLEAETEDVTDEDVAVLIGRIVEALDSAQVVTVKLDPLP